MIWRAEHMAEEKKSAVTAIIGAFCMLVGIKYFFAPCAPFIIGFAVSTVSVKAVRKLGVKRKKAGKRLAAAFSVLIYSVSIALLALLGKLIYHQISELYIAWSRDEGKIIGLIKKLRLVPDFISEKLFPGFSEDAGETLSLIIKSLTEKLFSAFSSFLGKAAAQVPSALFFSVVAVFSGILFCFCYDSLPRFFGKYFPEGKLGRGMTAAVMKTAKSELLISFLIFSVLYLGFSLARVRYSLALALITAIFDALPAIGTGIVLAPYAAVMFFTGERKTAIILLIIWAVTSLARQLTEPKLVGEGLGVPAVVSLFVMYACIKLFGAAGALVSPLLLTLASVYIGAEKEKK